MRVSFAPETVLFSYEGRVTPAATHVAAEPPEAKIERFFAGNGDPALGVKHPGVAFKVLKTISGVGEKKLYEILAKLGAARSVMPVGAGRSLRYCACETCRGIPAPCHDSAENPPECDAPSPETSAVNLRNRRSPLGGCGAAEIISDDPSASSGDSGISAPCDDSAENPQEGDDPDPCADAECDV